MDIDDSQIEEQAPADSACAVATSEAVLEMRGVSLRKERRDARLRRVNFRINQGELVLVRRPTGETKQLLASAVLGLIKPRRGDILIEGKCWRETPYGERLQMRSRIGRVFDTGGWLISLSVIDNIMLAERHHRHENDEALKQRVLEMASEFGINLPTDPPAYVEAWKLRICQWMRALVGNPKLLVLERPFTGIADKHRQSFYDAERKYRDNGGATLWISDCPHVWASERLRNANRLEIVGENLVPRNSEASQ